MGLLGGIDVYNGIKHNFSSVSYTAFGVIFFALNLIYLAVLQYLKLQTNVAIETEKTKLLYAICQLLIP